MAKTLDWSIGLLIYFTFLFILTGLFNNAGVFADNNAVVVDSRFTTNFQANVNQTTTQPPTQNVVQTSASFADTFNFFNWDFRFYEGEQLMASFWIVRLVFVFIPLFVLVLTILYFFRGMS